MITLVIFPFLPINPYVIHVAIMIFLWAYLAIAWNILGGYTGQISLGHAAFFGLGAYFTYFSLKWFHISPWIGMLIAAGISVLSALVIGYVTFKYGLKGIFFALATIAFSMILQDLFIAFRDITGGSLGVYYPYTGTNLLYYQFESEWPYYFIILAMLICELFIIKKMKNTILYFIAIRENEDVAVSVGINVTKFKLFSLLISSVLVSLGGTFYFQYYRYIDPSTVFGLDTSLEIVIIAIFGGMYNVWGPILGAIILVPISEILRITLGGSYFGVYLIIYGLLLIIVLRFAPKGIYGMIESFMNQRAQKLIIKISNNKGDDKQ
jgi:branched-chain amino acid transport system permease protein